MRKLQHVIRNISWLYKPYLKSAKILVVFSLFFSLLIMPLSRVIAVYFPKLVMDSLVSNTSFGNTLFLVLIISSIQLAIPLFEDFLNICIRERYQTKIEISVKRDVYKKAQLTDYQFIDSPDYYDDYKWAIDEYSNKCKESFLLFETLLSTISVIISLFIAALTAVPWAVFFAIISIAFRTWGYLKINHLEVERQDKCIMYSRKRDYVHRVFYSRQYAADIKSTKLSDYLFFDYDIASARTINIIKKYSNKILNWAFKCDLIYRACMIMIILSIAYSIYTGRIQDTGAYITMMLAVEQLDNCLYELFEVIKQASSLSLYATRIRKFFDRESVIEKSEGTESPENGAFDVTFNAVSFGYPSSKFLIRNFNLSLRKGEKVAIVGENGAGKSTILKLLLRLYDVHSGCIMINGIPIKNYNVKKLRSKIGVAFQNTHVYALTFRNNIELYNTMSKSALERIVNVLHLRDILNKTSSGINSDTTREFNQSGIELSGGEIQKLGLARVLSDNFGLLILDEPSSALDPFSEHEISQLIMSNINRTTTIIIAHRLSTVKDADRILLIEKGEIMESGTHEELMKLHKRYYEMYTIQAESYKQ